jgi:hypothetical protein
VKKQILMNFPQLVKKNLEIFGNFLFYFKFLKMRKQIGNFFGIFFFFCKPKKKTQEFLEKSPNF